MADKKMSQAAVIGTFWTTLDKAKKDLFAKEARFEKTFVIIEHQGGFLVVPLRQADKVRPQHH